MNCARWDLCGGRSVMGVSTAIVFFGPVKVAVTLLPCFVQPVDIIIVALRRLHPEHHASIWRYEIKVRDVPGPQRGVQRL